MKILKDELEFAVQLVKESASLAREIQNKMVTPAMEKSDRSPVTVADYAIQALVGKRLVDNYRDAVLVAEESSAALRSNQGNEISSTIAGFLRGIFPDTDPGDIHNWIDIGSGEAKDRYWVLDPIDGTKGFLRKAHYAVALALIEKGEIILGVLGCPALKIDLESQEKTYEFRPESGGEILYARRGEGAWVQKDEEAVRLHVSNRMNVLDARVLRSFESGHTDTSMMSSIVREMGIRQEPVLMDSQAKYSLLAAGSGDLLFRLISPKLPNYREKIWDQAAGVLITREAGGRVTDLDGKELDFTTGRRLELNRGIVASNGFLHDYALDAVSRLGA
jgi:3'(2'), 5'-bisphosphate nucleotidase